MKVTEFRHCEGFGTDVENNKTIQILDRFKL